VVKIGPWHGRRQRGAFAVDVAAVGGGVAVDAEQDQGFGAGGDFGPGQVGVLVGGQAHLGGLVAHSESKVAGDGGAVLEGIAPDFHRYLPAGFLNR
jgi:hypothetical protein